ncbi:hypothetical protein [Plastoroseomonas hellenica]|uniref:hypothetical protein n=1 Tax=Plastoroseomonas hellenica TaxID=2687306 RepID=UPI001BABCD98|nr:hypothetical protein [Plastoroseomonas hellenica]MBR0644376.1 hypothetical protein [Plastoroseomonas hellenica]
MTSTQAKKQLTDFLEHHAFQPVLRAKPDRFSPAQRDELTDLQGRTRTEVERFRGYGSAEAVVINFRRDLHSAKAREVQHRLSRLGLPVLPEVREDFEALANRLAVSGDGS